MNLSSTFRLLFTFKSLNIIYVKKHRDRNLRENAKIQNLLKKNSAGVRSKNIPVAAVRGEIIDRVCRREE